MKKYRNERGSSALPYGLIVGLIGVVALFAIGNMGESIKLLFGEVGQEMETAATAATSTAAEAEAPVTPPDATEDSILTASDGVAVDRYGSAVAVTTTDAIIGSLKVDGNRGAIYHHSIASCTGGTCTETTRLEASDRASADRLGIVVAMSGRNVIGAAYGDDAFRGAAYYYDLDNLQSCVTTTQTICDENAKLLPSNRQNDTRYGWRIGMDGDEAIVSSFGHDSVMGAGFYYDLSICNSGTCTEIRELNASDRAASDKLGYGTAISNGMAVLGAPGDETNMGAAYLYDIAGATNCSVDPIPVCTETAKLTASDGTTESWFGFFAALDGNRAIIGADHKNSNTGAAYYFDISTCSGSCTETAILAPAGLVAGDNFGVSTAISGTGALIGAAGGGVSQGTAYYFDLSACNTGTCTEAAIITASNGTSTDSFGYGVAVSGTTALIGASTANSDKGAAYLFTLSP